MVCKRSGGPRILDRADGQYFLKPTVHLGVSSAASARIRRQKLTKIQSINAIIQNPEIDSDVYSRLRCGCATDERKAEHGMACAKSRSPRSEA
jgi:hypothetical protein